MSESTEDQSKCPRCGPPLFQGNGLSGTGVKTKEKGVGRTFGRTIGFTILLGIALYLLLVLHETPQQIIVFVRDRPSR